MKKQAGRWISLCMAVLVLPFLFAQAWQLPEGEERNDRARVQSAKPEADPAEEEQAAPASAPVMECDSAKTAGGGSVQWSDSGFVKTMSGSDVVSFAPGVTAGMYEPDYWLASCGDPKEPLMTEEEIGQLNKKILMDESLTYNIFSEEFRSTFRSELGEENYGFGICVGRTEIKALPQAEPTGDDPYFDENLLTTARTNAPVLVDGQTEDGAYYHVISYDYQGWARAGDVALCQDVSQWEQILARSGWAEFFSDGTAAEQASILTVTVPRLRLELSGELLTMGTTMRLLDREEAENLGKPGSSIGCYVVELAGRTEEGLYQPRYETIPLSAGVVRGYRKLNREALLEQMFLFLGNAYGWGNSHESVDCSGLIQDVLSVFGIRMPRDAKQQQQVPLSRLTFPSTMERAGREEILDLLSPGDILYLPGHIMFYLGKAEGEYYVLSAASSMKAPGASEEEVLTVRRVIINSLSMERKNGNSWMGELERAVLL